MIAEAITRLTVMESAQLAMELQKLVGISDEEYKMFFYGMIEFDPD